MAKSKITILKNTSLKPKPDTFSEIISFEELRAWVGTGKIIRELLRYQEAKLLTYKIDVLTKPLVTALLLKSLSRKSCFIEDEQGERLDIKTRVLASLFWKAINDFRKKRALLNRVQDELDRLESGPQLSESKRRLDLKGTPVYLRSDLAFGVRSGGSIGHIAGVLNNLDNFTGKPVFITSDTIPTVRQDIETFLVAPRQVFWDFRELPTLFFNEALRQNINMFLRGTNVPFVYQRYGINNFSGIRLAKAFSVPFILEYNGSEIWVSRNWGKPLKYEAISERIELLNLRAADLIVVVSEPLQEELLARGIEASKVLVNPNGVDPGQYMPELDGTVIRRKHGLGNKVVIGFIGTFGRWHGAEVLANAFGQLLHDFPEYRERVRLLMIGDGITMPQVRENIEKLGLSDACILTGTVPQQEGPEYLAACDILASPHVPNVDGTKFFGSPTKLFEYMAMGKGIVASDLDQIGEVLEHNETAWLVEPGNVDSLAQGLKKLIDDEQLRNRLGKAAREEVVAKYTWKAHTEKIIQKLVEVTGQSLKSIDR